MTVTASTDKTNTNIRIMNNGIYCHCDTTNWLLKNLQMTSNMSTKYPHITQNKEHFLLVKHISGSIRHNSVAAKHS